MIRHPLLVAVELLVTVLVAVLGHLGLSRPRPQPKPLQFALTVLGEKELEDGSWAGVDLLRTPWAHADRFQLTVTPAQRSQLEVDVVGADGASHRLYPVAGQDGVVAPGRLYALPSPRGFYELDGRARLRVRLRAPGATQVSLATPRPDEVVRTYPLSDGSRFGAVELGYQAPTAGEVQLELSR